MRMCAGVVAVAGLDGELALVLAGEGEVDLVVALRGGIRVGRVAEAVLAAQLLADLVEDAGDGFFFGDLKHAAAGFLGDALEDLLAVDASFLPATATADELLAVQPDGVFFSNGPGDPATADYAVDAMRGVLRERVPVFGICFGNQVLGRALGFGTYKLKFGHRGVNQPVQDRITGQVHVTSHNHGFAVDAPTDRATETEFGRVEVSHVDLNDGVVEGLRCLDAPAFSVQYHPEAAPGPHDATGLFQRFAELMEANK